MYKTIIIREVPACPWDFNRNLLLLVARYITLAVLRSFSPFAAKKREREKKRRFSPVGDDLDASVSGPFGYENEGLV